MSEPVTPIISRGRVHEWLEGLGFSEAMVRKLIEDDVIKGFKLPGRIYAMYETAQIKRDVLSGLAAQNNQEKQKV